LSYASARGLALCMVAYFTTGNTTSPVSLRGAQRPLAVIARLTQSAEAISLRRWSRETGLLRFARNDRIGGECGNEGAVCVIVSWLLGR